MRREGVVVDRVGDMVQVQFERAESCKHCHACSGEECKAMLPVAGSANPGDVVEVEVPDAKIVQLSAMTYGLPLATLLAGVFLGGMIHRALRLAMNAELFSAMIGGALMLIGLLALHMLDNKWAFRTEFQPRIVSVRGDGKPRNP
ncbi:MAG: SoxR reducing system RseC family protein [Oscillospiraceae bacterium]|jgi:positive regulator of sigma E activity|nr:SoxR reducing system RseC family protein [Oscillospiraceae bacterium]